MKSLFKPLPKSDRYINEEGWSLTRSELIEQPHRWNPDGSVYFYGSIGKALLTGDTKRVGLTVIAGGGNDAYNTLPLETSITFENGLTADFNKLVEPTKEERERMKDQYYRQFITDKMKPQPSFDVLLNVSMLETLGFKLKSGTTYQNIFNGFEIQFDIQTDIIESIITKSYRAGIEKGKEQMFDAMCYTDVVKESIAKVIKMYPYGDGPEDNKPNRA